MNRLIAVIAALIVTPALAQEKPHKGPLGQCAKPKSPLYQQQNANEPIEVRLMADHATLNQGQGFMNQRSVKGVIAIKRNGEAAFDYMPVMVRNRGKSRGDACPVKPVRFIFLDQKIEREVEAALASAGINVDAKEYMLEYFKRFYSRQIADTEMSVAQNDNVFDKLGDDVKFVTHCGYDTRQFVGAPTPAEQDTRLLSEYYLYKIIDELSAPVETARLAHITYLTPDGIAIFPGVDNTKVRLGFFREPPKSVAKRCGLLPKRPADIPPPRAVDENSSFQTTFINKFLHNSDYGYSHDHGHNTNLFFDRNAVTHPAPYDFDLAGVFYTRGNYNGGTLDENLARMIAWLQEKPKERSIPMVERTVAKRAAMTAILQNSLLEQERKTLMLNWLNSYMDALEQFLKDWR